MPPGRDIVRSTCAQLLGLACGHSPCHTEPPLTHEPPLDTATWGRNQALSFCARCMRVAYCNAACQKQHWKEHRKACGAGGGKP